MEKLTLVFNSHLIAINDVFNRHFLYGFRIFIYVYMAKPQPHPNSRAEP